MTFKIEMTSSYTIAKQTPLLQEKQLCNFLELMDQEEQVILDGEKQNAETSIGNFDAENNFLKTVSKIGTAACTGGAISTLAVFTNTKFFDDKYKLYMASFCTSLIGTSFFMAKWGGIVRERECLESILNSSVMDARLLRIQGKIRTIGHHLTRNPDDASNPQLEAARDYFRLKEIKMMHSEVNRIEMRYQNV